MRLRSAAGLASVVRYRLLRGEIDAETIILMVVSVFVLFGGMGFQMVANGTGTALSLCPAAAFALGLVSNGADPPDESFNWVADSEHRGY